MWKVACTAVLFVTCGCASTDDFDPSMPVKSCQRDAYWRAEAVAMTRYDKDLAKVAFQDAYNDCIRWKDKAKSWLKEK